MIVEVLRIQRQQVNIDSLSTADWVEHGLVFPNRRGRPTHGPRLTRKLQEVLARLGITKRRFHDLRHTAASLLLATGVDMRVIQEYLGHSDYQLTANTYAHPDEGSLRKAADKMSRFVGS